MEDSPLIYICSDISNIIGEYLKTIQDYTKVKKEFSIKVRIALVKYFNIKTLKLDFTKYLKSSRVYDQSLYFIPTENKNLQYYNGYWVWKEPKRFGQVSHNFKEIFMQTSRRTGYCCSCMTKCRYSKCPYGGMRWPMILFPNNLFELNNLGYHNIRLLLNEIKINKFIPLNI